MDQWALRDWVLKIKQRHLASTRARCEKPVKFIVREVVGFLMKGIMSAY